MPVRLELGPRDLADDAVTLVRRISGSKTPVPLSGVAKAVTDAIERQQAELLAEATARRDDHIADVADLAEAAEAAATGWARLPWSKVGTEGEAQLAADGVTVRCLVRAGRHGAGHRNRGRSASRSSRAATDPAPRTRKGRSSAGPHPYTQMANPFDCGRRRGLCPRLSFRWSPDDDCRPPTRTDRTDRRRPRRRPVRPRVRRVPAQGHPRSARWHRHGGRGSGHPCHLAAARRGRSDPRQVHAGGVESRARTSLRTPDHYAWAVGQRWRSRRCPRSTASAGSPAPFATQTTDES